MGAHQREKCPHKDSTCHACGIKAHIKAVCLASDEKRKAHAATKGRREKPQQANSAQPASDGEEDESAQALCTTPTMDTVAAVSPYLSYVHIIFDANQPGFRPMHIYSVLDMGASVTIIHARFASMHNVRHNNRESIWKAAGKAVLRCNGSTRVTLTCPGKNISFETTVIFSDNLIHDCLLGVNDVQRLQFLDKSWPKPLQVSTVNSITPPRSSINKPITSAIDTRNVLIAHFRDTLNDKPMTGPPMDITFDPMVTPIPKRFNYVKQTPLHMKKAAQDVIDELIDKRIIVPVKEPTDWCAPAFFVPKPDGRARLVTNYTYINQFIKCPVHPFPSPKAIPILSLTLRLQDCRRYSGTGSQLARNHGESRGCPSTMLGKQHVNISQEVHKRSTSQA